MCTISGSHVTVPASQNFPRSWNKGFPLGLQAQWRANFKWDFKWCKFVFYVLDHLVPFSYARAPFCFHCIHTHTHTHTSCVKLNSGLLYPTRILGNLHFCTDQSFNLYRLSPRNCKSQFLYGGCHWGTRKPSGGSDQEGTFLRYDSEGLTQWKTAPVNV